MLHFDVIVPKESPGRLSSSQSSSSSKENRRGNIEVQESVWGGGWGAGQGRSGSVTVSLGQSFEDGVDLLGDGCQGELKLVLETTRETLYK